MHQSAPDVLPPSTIIHTPRLQQFPKGALAITWASTAAENLAFPRFRVLASFASQRQLARHTFLVTSRNPDGIGKGLVGVDCQLFFPNRNSFYEILMPAEEANRRWEMGTVDKVLGEYSGGESHATRE